MKPYIMMSRSLPCSRQAGRELRVLVKPDEVDDTKSYKIAREIKEKIEKEMQYPGTIKVTVIRETRAEEEAK